MDVPVNMQRKLQPSLQFDNVEMPQIPFFVRVFGHSCFSTEVGTHSANCVQKTGDSTARWSTFL